MNLQEAESFVNASTWKLASSMPQNPHWYTLRANSQEDDFIAFVQLIREKGYKKSFFRKEFIYLDIGEYCYWTMGSPLAQTILINRSKRS